ncbi:MAG: protein translocase subunit SecD [Ruminococcaceae bacterium]|nr:protein translocase subunit SecD [Oscillospiraceae bacterium]
MNYSRASGIARFVLLLLAIVFVCASAICGVYINDDTKLNGIFEDGTIRLGLDLAGGSVVTFQAETDDTGETLDVGMDSVQTVMRDRLDNQGLTEALCYRTGDDMITIEIPDVDDPNEAIENYMQTAVLEFRDANGKVVLTGEHVETATPARAPAEDGTQQLCVQLKLTDAGATLFADATKTAAANGTTIGIYMDNNLISNPSVDKQYASTGITGGEAIISGSFTEFAEVQQLAGNINAGALKYDLKVVEQRTVGATLGENSLSTSVIAGAIGLLLVIVFMCIYYKVPGVMASISLALYVGLFFFLLIITQANLTLAGIAGVVLSIGMAVDANVVIFERIKEEIDMGKSAKAAINGGFKRAFAAILDSNITTIIACAVLYFLGSGTIKGFATTLFMGVVISLITALVITRALLYLCVAMGITKPESYRAIGRRAK